MDVLVMENIFYAGALSPIFDLKGSERARLARDDPANPTQVLLDQNLLQRNLATPILVTSAPSPFADSSVQCWSIADWAMDCDTHTLYSCAASGLKHATFLTAPS